ncbi:MAG TPA: methylated-DNA--[protein]-cysteine S-methyltransferase [Nitrososphaerales archaeon]|nr:methylated-DNA--[protein]-cysteine S-methyltransferase [Nitrososphaerales archaeon]
MDQTQVTKVLAQDFSSSTGSRHLGLVEEACRFMRENAASRVTLAELGKRFGVSPYHLQRTFTEVMGISPRKYLEECRLSILKLRLARGEPVIEALRGSGYSSQSWLYKDSRVKLGMTPADYKAGGAGRLVMYCIGDSTIGRLLVATTSHGICSVNVGGDDRELLGALREEFPRARLVRSKKAELLVDGVNAHLRGQEVRLPLDIRGTDFQLRVWTALRLIPPGSTRTYGEVAAMIGEPRAVRAVGTACKSNPVPLIIPCHRVIRKDGGMGGYALGLSRKKALLEQERRASHG